jgi:hypothetical protein
MFPAKLEPEPRLDDVFPAKSEPQFDLKDTSPERPESEPQPHLDDVFPAKPEPHFDPPPLDFPQLHPVDASPDKPEPELAPEPVEAIAVAEARAPKPVPPVRAAARASRFRLAAAASIAAVVLLSLLSLNGSASVVNSPATQAVAAKRPVLQLSAEDSLRAMEIAARAFLPRPIVIAVIAPGRLDPVSIQAPAKPRRPVVGRRNFREAAARSSSDR